MTDAPSVFFLLTSRPTHRRCHLLAKQVDRKCPAEIANYDRETRTDDGLGLSSNSHPPQKALVRQREPPKHDEARTPRQRDGVGGSNVEDMSPYVQTDEEIVRHPSERGSLEDEIW